MPPPLLNKDLKPVPPIAVATVDALVATNSVTFACVNNCVTDINANNNPEYFITC